MLLVIRMCSTKRCKARLSGKILLQLRCKVDGVCLSEVK